MFNIIILLVLIIIIFNFREINKDKFCNYIYNPEIQSPQSNYLKNIKILKNQDKYKYELSNALNPIPLVQCDTLKNKSDCNDNGCNWFGSFCSSIYSSYL